MALTLASVCQDSRLLATCLFVWTMCYGLVILSIEATNLSFLFGLIAVSVATYYGIKRNDKQAELETLQMKTPGDLWTEDLDALSKQLDEIDEIEKEVDNELVNISATFIAKAIAEKGKRKSEMVDEFMPWAYGRLVAPSIDEEMKKKAEIAVRHKEKKAKWLIRKKVKRRGSASAEDYQ